MDKPYLCGDRHHHRRPLRQPFADLGRGDLPRLLDLSEHRALARQDEAAAELAEGQRGAVRLRRGGQGPEVRRHLIPFRRFGRSDGFGPEEAWNAAARPFDGCYRLADLNAFRLLEVPNRSSTGVLPPTAARRPLAAVRCACSAIVQSHPRGDTRTGPAFRPPGDLDRAHPAGAGYSSTPGSRPQRSQCVVQGRAEEGRPAPPNRCIDRNAPLQKGRRT